MISVYIQSTHVVAIHHDKMSSICSTSNMQICVTSFNGFKQNNRKSKSTKISARLWFFTSEEMVVNDSLGYPKAYAKLYRNLGFTPYCRIYHWLRNENSSSIIFIRTQIYLLAQFLRHHLTRRISVINRL